MRTIAIASYKGGTGKTTTAINMAFDLARLHGKRVLVVDADSQGNASFELMKSANTKYGLYEVLTNVCKIQTAIYRSRFEGVDILPGKENIEELDILTPYALKNELDKLVYSIGHSKYVYDFCIIDCHPSMQAGTIAALTAADDIIIPLRPDRYSANGLEIMQGFIEKIRKNNMNVEYKCLVTMFKSTKSQMKLLAEIMEQNTCDIFNSCIRKCEAVNSSQDIRKPLILHRKKSNAALDYIEVTREYLESIEEED